ncbi:MAG: hypothetical protein FJ405_07405, partial [Verrucomicrobia bacterium]|nr:hypothetical protein [Verrucomicrobiota bacterium]
MRLHILPLVSILCMASTVPAQVKSTNGPAVQLTMDQAMVMALENNFQIAIQRVQSRSALYDLRGSYGAYDPS